MSNETADISVITNSINIFYYSDLNYIIDVWLGILSTQWKAWDFWDFSGSSVEGFSRPHY